MAYIYYLTHIHLDFGTVSLLPAECERVGIKRPLIVTDAGVKAAGVLAQAQAALGALHHAVFDGTPANPTEAAVRAAKEILIAEQCDGLIAVGGGSSIDLAKGLAIAATHDGPMTRYATIEGGSGLITDRVLPLIAVPTTAGTGSEVARGAILIVDDGRKLGFHSWHLLPKSAVMDPTLTLGLPPVLTAATGMDAVAHCMETFMAPAVNPPADGIALDGIGSCLASHRTCHTSWCGQRRPLEHDECEHARCIGISERTGLRALIEPQSRRCESSSPPRNAQCPVPACSG